MMTFDVPGTVTFRSVSRPAPRETWAEAMHRLAAKGLIAGCQVVAVNDLETECSVTSARLHDRSYRVTIDPTKQSARCDCTGWQVTGMCQHAALAVALLVGLPDRDAEPLTAMFRGRCAVTGRTIEPGMRITKSSRGGWMIVEPAGDERLAA